MTSIVSHQNNLVSHSQDSPEEETQEEIDEHNERLFFCPITLDFAVDNPVKYNGRINVYNNIGLINYDKCMIFA